VTGPEHYRLAEQLIESGVYDEEEPELYRRDIALAQVHATLALVMASAYAYPASEWHKAAGAVTE
jgi:hypothetical protein